MGYSQGVGGKDNSFPFQNTALPSAQPHFWCPQRISLLWLPTSVTPPLIQAVIGLWSSDQNQDARNFQETKFGFLKFFFHVCFKREKRREAQQPGYELSGELSNPNHLHLQKNVFP